MDVSIGELTLAVRTPPASAATSSGACERFARRVLESVSEQFAARWPGRVIFVRELTMSWRVPAHAFEHEAAIEAAAADVLATLAELVGRAAETAGPNAEVVAFGSRADYLYAYWEAIAHGTAQQYWWFNDAAAVGAGETAETIIGALAVAWRTDRLVAILACLPALWRDRIGAVTRARDVVIGTPVSRLERSVAVARLAGPSQSMDPIAAAIWFAVAASEALPGQSAGEQTNLARVAHAQWSRALPPAAASAVSTEFGGAAFLLSLAMEVDLGNMLWEACLPEGGVIGVALANLIGEEAARDPLIRAIVGDWSGEPSVETEQQEEVATSLLREFVRAASRRGATIPRVRLRLWHRSHERFLVACAADEFPCFVWPADSAPALGRGLALFLRDWPCRSAQPEAAPGLAAVDHAGRVRENFDLGTGPAPFLAAAKSPILAAIATQIGGTLGALWSTRLGLEAQLGRGALVNRYLRVPGRVRVTPERVDVILSMDQIDLDVRRAGLDRNPGWITWLQKHISVEFADEPGAA
jgi:hypothetical protein